jgi:arginase
MQPLPPRRARWTYGRYVTWCRRSGAAVGWLDHLAGFWVHLDVDVLDDAVMPAVDYRLPGGLSWDELESVLATAVSSERAIDLDVTVFNPCLGPDGRIAARLTECLHRGLAALSHHE